MISLLQQTWISFNENNSLRTASALAYTAAFSIAPMLVLMVGIAKIFVEPEDVQGSVEAGIRSVAGDEGVEQVRVMVDNRSESQKSSSKWASAIGTLVLLFGATNFFAQLQTALNEIWSVRADPSRSGIWHLITKRILSLGMIITLGVILVITIIASSLLVAFGERLGFWMPVVSRLLFTTASWLLAFGVLTFLFAAVFRYLPDAEIRWRDVAIGSGVTAGMFLLGHVAISFYLGMQDAMSLYGAAGSMIVILTWVYYSSVILLFGATLTRVGSNRSGRNIIPSEFATKDTSE